MDSRALGFVVLGILRSLGAVYGLLPLRARILANSTLGGLLRRLNWRKAVIQENLLRAFPGDSADVRQTRERFERSAYTHIGALFLEFLLFLGPLHRSIRKRAFVEGTANLEPGSIMLASHTGNWEITAGSAALQGVNLMVVATRLKPAWFDEAVDEGRSKIGVKTAHEPRSMRDVLRHLKDGGTVAIVLDQYSGPPVGVRVPFFGVPVGTGGFVALLAKRTGAKVYPSVSWRGADGRWLGRISPALPWIADENPHREIALNTAQYVSVIEADIRANPSEWLWAHRRFKGDLSPLRPEEWDAPRERGV